MHCSNYFIWAENVQIEFQEDIFAKDAGPQVQMTD